MTIWTVPTHLPDLRRVDDNIVAIDTEDERRGLARRPRIGWPWHGGWICGISVAWREGGEIRANYIPMRHPNTDNFDPAAGLPLAQGSHRGRRSLRHHERSV